MRANCPNKKAGGIRKFSAFSIMQSTLEFEKCWYWWYQKKNIQVNWQRLPNVLNNEYTPIDISHIRVEVSDIATLSLPVKMSFFWRPWLYCKIAEKTTIRVASINTSPNGDVCLIGLWIKKSICHNSWPRLNTTLLMYLLF